MNRFNLISLILHIFIFGFFLRNTEVKMQGLKLSDSNKMVVSVREYVKSTSPKKVEEVKEAEETTEIKEVENKIKEKILEKEKLEENIQKEIEPEIKKEKIVKKIIEKQPEKKLEKKIKKEIKKNIKKTNEKKIIKQKTKKYNEFEDGEKFIKGNDGVFTAIKSDGIQYEILKEKNPKKPMMAKKMGYRKTNEIKVQFVVGLNGEVDKINFISGELKYGFKDEVEKALRQWRFKPIIYKGKNIKMNFEKNFVFR